MARGELRSTKKKKKNLFQLFRIQIISEGKKRKLVIKNCKLEDAGMITAKTTGDERSAPLGVKRESSYDIFCTVVDSVGFKYTFASRRLSKINILDLKHTATWKRGTAYISIIFPKFVSPVMTVFYFL